MSLPVAALMGWLTVLPAAAQNRANIQIERGDGARSTLSVQLDRGYASIPVTVLGDLGWNVATDGPRVTLTAADEITIELRLETPFFRWDGVVLQFSDAPYRAGGMTYVPLQLLTDFLPRRLPGLYDFTGSSSLLRAGDLTLLRPRPPTTPTSAPTSAPNRQAANAAEVRDAGPSPYAGVRVVVIDPGHGGADPGALGPGGLREKTVALAIASRLERLLRSRPGLEVHMIRDDDTFVDVWERGQIASNAKGERPGVFLSIHANSFPTRREARGFETYFLSDARTEHERRVSAIENAPLSMRAQATDEGQVEDLDFILRDLRNYEYAHWSEDLAGLVQDELNGFHPGPNRGVKQGVLAVLTNALMPSVLIEVGYLSNSDEAQLLAESDFHASAARAIADAVGRFFERYPPGGGTGSSREDP